MSTLSYARPRPGISKEGDSEQRIHIDFGNNLIAVHPLLHTECGNHCRDDTAPGSRNCPENSYAILYFQNALKLDSKNNDVRYNLAQAFASDRQYDNSITTYKELLKTSPENYDGYIELAKVYMAKGDNETAAKYLEFVQIKKPDFKASVIKSLLQTIK